MFGPDFFPSPDSVINSMLFGIDFSNSVVLDPSAGSGNIIAWLQNAGVKQVLACENHPALKRIVQSKCKVIADDFLTVTSDMVSHVDYIVMNPPFSADEKHILHAYSIAPAGCSIIALCNWETINNPYTAGRKQLRSIVDQSGRFENLGSCFDTAERKTYTKIGLIRIQKPGANSDEFSGFFMEEDIEQQDNGIMSYNVVRDLVNRYIGAVKLFDEQLTLGAKMNALTSGFFSGKLSFSCSSNNVPVLRNDFKKDLQKEAWIWIFAKMNMQKYSTKGLREDINKFVEKQTEIPFTMRNIYKMIEIVIGTTGSRMDKALIEVFEKLTKHTHENRYNLEGWKTNSHYMLNRKFILPHACIQDRWNKGGSKIDVSYSGTEEIQDVIKALYVLSGKKYDDVEYLHNIAGKHFYGEVFEYEFFRVRCYKKGTMHFEFKDENIWILFNRNIARILNYPLPEAMKRKAA